MTRLEALFLVCCSAALAWSSRPLWDQWRAKPRGPRPDRFHDCVALGELPAPAPREVRIGRRVAS